MTTPLTAMFVIVLATTSSCMTSMEARRLQTSVGAMGLRLDDIDRLDQVHKDQVGQLRVVLDQATALLKANANDVGGKEAKEETDIASLQAQIDRLARSVDLHHRQNADTRSSFAARLTTLERGQAMIAERVAALPPDDENELWREAAAHLASAEGDEGRRFYRTFIDRFPQDPRAPQAYLAIGASFLREKRFSSAAAAFQRLLDAYPASPEVPEAKLRLSSAFVQLRFCTDARSLLRDLVRHYPTSAPAAEARRELRIVEHLPRGECTS